MKIVMANQYHDQMSADSYVRAGYGLKKAKKVLTSPDPDYREKVELVLRTLQNLQSGELFFFIDEMGPLRVKEIRRKNVF